MMYDVHTAPRVVQFDAVVVRADSLVGEGPSSECMEMRVRVLLDAVIFVWALQIAAQAGYSSINAFFNVFLRVMNCLQTCENFC